MNMVFHGSIGIGTPSQNLSVLCNTGSADSVALTVVPRTCADVPVAPAFEATPLHHHRFLDQPFAFFTADGHPAYGVLPMPRYASLDHSSLYQGNLQHGASIGVIPDRFQFIVGDFMCDSKSVGSTLGDSQTKPNQRVDLEVWQFSIVQ